MPVDNGHWPLKMTATPHLPASPQQRGAHDDIPSDSLLALSTWVTKLEAEEDRMRIQILVATGDTNGHPTSGGSNVCCVGARGGDTGDTAECHVVDGISRTRAGVESANRWNAERPPPGGSKLCCVRARGEDAGDAAERRAVDGIARTLTRIANINRHNTERPPPYASGLCCVGAR